MALDRLNQYGVSMQGRGAENMSALSIPRGFGISHESPTAEVDEGDEEHPATGGNPLSLMFILLGLIVAMFFVHKSSSIIKSEAFGVNWFTFFEVGVMATFFILLLKAVFGRFHLYGITPAVASI